MGEIPHHPCLEELRKFRALGAARLLRPPENRICAGSRRVHELSEDAVAASCLFEGKIDFVQTSKALYYKSCFRGKPSPSSVF